jgi:hypothetical protein
MTEREPIEMKAKPDKKGRVIFEAKEEVKTPITKEAHRRQLINQRDYCLDQAEKFKEMAKTIDEMIEKMDEEEKSGKIIRCFDEGDHLSYEIHEKPPLGFPRPQKEASTKDASAWREETQERQAKKE